MWRNNVIVEATPVIPGQENRRTAPVRSLHDGIDKSRHVGLTCAHQGRWMFTILAIGYNPGDGWQGAVLGGSVEVVQLLDVAKLAILFHCVKVGQRIPDLWRSRTLWLRSAAHRGIIFTVGLRSICYIVGPTYFSFVEQVRKIGPGIVGSSYSFFTLYSIRVLQCVLATH